MGQPGVLVARQPPRGLRHSQRRRAPVLHPQRACWDEGVIACMHACLRHAIAGLRWNYKPRHAMLQRTAVTEMTHGTLPTHPMGPSATAAEAFSTHCMH